MKNDVRSLGIFISMLGLMKYDDASYYEKEQLNNIVTLVNTKMHETKIDSALADLINLAVFR